MQTGKVNQLPIGLIAFENKKPIGTVSLLHSDIKRPSKLYPWLAGLIVMKKYRRKGYGKNLVSECTKEAKRLKFSSVYLYTKIPNFYEDLGWEIHSEVKEDVGCFVMKFDLIEHTYPKK